MNIFKKTEKKTLTIIFLKNKDWKIDLNSSQKE
jgi:hypothetical protein